MKVLYLEDDEDSIELVSFSLGLEQIKVTPVSSCDEALERVKRERFDLYLLDGLVESGYSFDACRRLRQHDPSVPIVYYTALGFPQDVKEGVSAGADAYLIKPYIGDLAETLKNVVAEKARNRKPVPPAAGGPFTSSSAAAI